MDRTLHCLTLVTVIFRRNANERPTTRYSPLNPTANAHVVHETFPSEVAENDGITEITTKFSTNYSPFHSRVSPIAFATSVFFPLSLSFAISLLFSLFFFFCILLACLAFLYSAHPIRPFREERSGPLFLLVIFVHMLDTDSVRTLAAFALIELFLTCPPNKLAVRSCSVRARR